MMQSAAPVQGFRYFLRVRYAECDAQKVVFNARYGDYVDLATVEFIRAIGFGAALMSGELDYQVVRQTTEWQAPARFDDVLELQVGLVKLGTTSFTLRVEFRRAGEAGLLASTETVYVNVVPHALTKQALSTDFRAALETGARDGVIDHAGALGASQQR